MFVAIIFANKNKTVTNCDQLKMVARKGASVAGDARKKIESKTGNPVLTGRNAKSLKKITK